MNIKKCSKCGQQPNIQTDELGMTYRLICKNCGRNTSDIISPNSSLNNPHCDELTMSRLINEWNSMN